MNKIFSGSIIALLLGIFLASPLLYTNVVIAPHTEIPDIFDVNVVYAYMERKNITVSESDFLSASFANDTIEITTINRVMCINFTRLSEEVVPCDARIEVYLIKVYSDEGFIGNLQRYEGIIYNKDLTGVHLETDLMKFFGGRPLSGGGSITNKWDIGQSLIGSSSGGGNTWVPTFGDPETIYISVNRLGWVTINGNSNETIILSEPEVVAEAQLEKYRDGFLYNTIIPEDKLANIHPLNVAGKLFELMGDMD